MLICLAQPCTLSLDFERRSPRSDPNRTQLFYNQLSDMGVIRAVHNHTRRRAVPISVFGFGCGEFLLGAKAGSIINATSAKATMRQIRAPSKRDERAG